MPRGVPKMLPQKPGKDKQLIKMGSRQENIGQALAGMKPGDAREGFLAGGNIIRKPDFVVQENLSAEEKAMKKALQTILGQTIEPNAISSKSTPVMDRRSLVTKLGRSTLDDLMRLCPERLKTMNSEGMKAVLAGTDELTDGEKAEIQNLYLDVSP